MIPRVRIRWPIVAVVFAAGSCGSLPAQLTSGQTRQNLDSFDVIWNTVRDRHPDPKLNGLNWPEIRHEVRPQIERAQSMDEVRTILREMLARLGASHYSIIPGEAYRQAQAPPGPGKTESSVAPADSVTTTGVAGADPAAATAGVRSGLPIAAIGPVNPSLGVQVPPGETAEDLSQGTLVRFGNLPETRVWFESRQLPAGAGYIRFNEFLDPVNMMPRFAESLRGFAGAPGVILDLRGNPGGIGMMAMGIAGFFVDKPGLKLGEMKMRDATLNFVIFPRPEIWRGRLAILVDEKSASTTEILAGGLQDLGRARIFGTRTAGAALPSDIIRLPNGDGFQYAQATYTSAKGRVLEGEGVTPDVVVAPTSEGAESDHDPVIEAAETWIASR